jgi:hypothetical protein
MNNDIRPLKDVVEIGGRFPTAYIIILVLMALAILIFAYFKNKKKTEEKPVLPPRPAEEIAREALKALIGMRLIEKGLIKEYHIKLSDIIRSYIENRYGISALDRTTRELSQEIKTKGIERPHADRINNFLEDCDMVKFAKYAPGRKEIEEIYKSAEEIIDATTPKITL